jgi:plasmid replication initiation protein
MNPLQYEKMVKQENKDLVQVSNSLVEMFIHKSNTVALKMLFYIAKQRRKESGEITNFTLSADDFANVCKLDQKTIKRNITAMQQTSITFVDRDENGEPVLERHIVLIPEVAYQYKKKIIEITMFKKVLNLIVEVEDYYTTIDAEIVMSMDSKHSIRMLMILEQIFGFKGSPENWDVKQQKTLTLDELNGAFGTKYQRMAEMERRVLKPVKEELDDKSEISFKYEINYGYTSPLQRGRPQALSVTIKLVQNKNRQRRLF